jgi:hypothetical protein
MNNILSSLSCGCDSKESSGLSPIILIVLLLCVCGGDGGLFGGGCGDRNDTCGNGLDGILPIILILCLCGGSF